ncbi:UbiA family prenyltransferase [Candidatus Micrarchaeota archaeon]|nr:UbiA family prenyltransferase [Candidatus Micrarchaeota archaeon]
MANSFSDRWLSVFGQLERMPAGPLQLAGVLMCVLTVRIVLEWSLESQKTIETPAALFLFLVYFASALGGIFLILWSLSGKAALSVAKVLAFFSPVLWIPPIWDFIASGGRGYALQFVFSPPPFWTAVSNACADCAGVSPGLRVEVLLAAIASAGFMYWATRSKVKSVFSALLVYGFVVFQAIWPAYLLGYTDHPYTDAFFTRELLSSYALMICAAVLIPWQASLAPSKRRLRWVRLLHYAGLALFGAAIGWPHWTHAWPGVLLPLAALLASIVFAFEAAVRVNDWSDQVIDRKAGFTDRPLKPFPTADVAGWVLLSALAGLAVGYPAWVWIVFALALSVAYSVPPLRLRWHVVPASVILAAVSVAVVAAGFSVGLLDQAQVPAELPSKAVLLVFGFIFFAAPFKDLKDAAGDRKAGVFTLASWLPESAARRICATLVLAAVLWATWLSGIPWLIGLAFALASSAAVAFIRNPERMEHAVFALDYAFLALLALHLSGFWVLA